MSLLLLFKAPPAVVTPNASTSYWRGLAWIGHALLNWPKDGALR